MKYNTQQTSFPFFPIISIVHVVKVLTFDK